LILQLEAPNASCRADFLSPPTHHLEPSPSFIPCSLTFGFIPYDVTLTVDSLSFIDLLKV